MRRVALEVYTRAALPQDWAATQNNLGVALRELGTRLGGKQGIQYLRESLSCYDNALSVFDERYYPAWRSQVLANRSKALKSLDSLQGSQRRGT